MGRKLVSSSVNNKQCSKFNSKLNNRQSIFCDEIVRKVSDIVTYSRADILLRPSVVTIT